MTSGLRLPRRLRNTGRPASWLGRPELVVVVVLLLAGALLRPVVALWSDPIAVAPQYARSAITVYEVLEHPGYLVPVTKRTPEEDVSAQNAVQLFLAGPVVGPDLVGAFAPDTELLEFERDGERVAVGLSAAALESDDLDRAVDALVLTLTELPGILAVSVEAGGTDLAADGTAVDAQTYLSRPAVNPESEAAAEGGTELYFTYDGEDRYLVPVTRASTLDEQVPGVALDEFLAGPLPDSGLESVVPHDVRVLSVRVDDGLATVDFNANLVYAYRLSKANALFVRRAVMATLTGLPEIEAGLIEIDGSRLLLYTCVNVTQEYPQARPWAINDDYYLSPIPQGEAAAA